MKVTETIMQGIKTTESINTEMILTCRLITITYTHNNNIVMYVIQYKLMCMVAKVTSCSKTKRIKRIKQNN